MFFPFRTDAPIYHWPIVTVGLIVVNTVIYMMCVSSGYEGVEPYLLVFGKGLHPTQWLTNIFLHGGFYHILGNMVWLWAFGLIVEGKLGWWKFLLVYLGIGMAQSAVSQIIMLAAPGGAALGASGAIFGLVAISLIWAPKNELTVFLFLGLFSRVFEVTIAMFAGCYLVFQVIMAWISQFNMSSELLHILGAFFGLGIGVFLLVTKRVDCEGWDLFSVWSGKHQRLPSEIGGWRERQKELETAVEQATDEQPGISHEAARAQIAEILSSGQPKLALVAHKRLLQMEPEWLLPQPLHLKLITLLLKEQEWEQAVEVMRHYLELHKQQDTIVRLKLAEVLVARLERPTAALKVLAKISPVALSPQQEQVAARLKARAKALRDEGVMELESDDF